MKKIKFKKLREKFKSLEMNKILCITGMITIGVIGIYAVLHYCSMEHLAIVSNSTIAPSPEVPVTAITSIFAFFLTYCGYNGILKNSRNKYKVDKNGIPYKQQVQEWYESLKKKEESASEEVSDDDN